MLVGFKSGSSFVQWIYWINLHLIKYCRDILMLALKPFAKEYFLASLYLYRVLPLTNNFNSVVICNWLMRTQLALKMEVIACKVQGMVVELQIIKAVVVQIGWIIKLIKEYMDAGQQIFREIKLGPVSFEMETKQSWYYKT